MDILTTAQNGYLDAKISNAQAVGQRASSAREDELRAAAKDFEAVFLGQMLRPMFDTLKTDGPFGGGHSEKIYRSMFVDEVAKEIAHNGSVGIADSILRDLIALQEAA